MTTYEKEFTRKQICLTSHVKVLNFTLESALLGTIEDWGQREPELFDHQIVSELHESDDEDDIEEDDVEYILQLWILKRLFCFYVDSLILHKENQTMLSDSLAGFCCEPNFQT